MENKIEYIEIENENVRLIATNYGCHIVKLEYKNKDNKFINTVITLKDADEYQKQDKYIGALAGRVANRIGNGKFTLNGQTYELYKNNGENHLHGGKYGFNTKIYDYKKEKDRIVFHRVSPDGEENYPGNLDLQVSYILIESGIRIEYKATTDRDTLINLTNHSYFTLGAKNGEDLFLKLNCNSYVENDDAGMATGKHVSVEGTAFDFRKMKRVGDDISQNDPQIVGARGYDHAFKINGNEDQMELYNSENGISMSVNTSMPYVHVYSANFLNGENGENGKVYARDAVCLETEYMPNGINNGYSNGIILKKGDTWNSYTEYIFSNKR